MMLHKLKAMWDRWRFVAGNRDRDFDFDRGNEYAFASCDDELEFLIQEYEGWVCVPREAAEKYNELLYAVATKHPGESRHETALRYIRQAETSSNNCQAAAKEKE